jgi:TatD DNase family protein
MQLVDAHTHHFNQKYRQLLILDIRNLPKEMPATPYCLGIHPWWVSDISTDDFFQLWQENQQDQHLVALGECGLDRLKDNWEQQLEVFNWQLSFAKKMHINRIIIHSVKSHDAILSCLKKHQYQGKVLWHDFNGNQQQIQQCLLFNSYFSVGQNLMRKARISEHLAHIPIDRLLFETDDQTNWSLEDLYQHAATILKIEQSGLYSTTNQTFTAFLS